MLLRSARRWEAFGRKESGWPDARPGIFGYRKGDFEGLGYADGKLEVENRFEAGTIYQASANIYATLGHRGISSAHPLKEYHAGHAGHANGYTWAEGKLSIKIHWSRSIQMGQGWRLLALVEGDVCISTAWEEQKDVSDKSLSLRLWIKTQNV